MGYKLSDNEVVYENLINQQNEECERLKAIRKIEEAIRKIEGTKRKEDARAAAGEKPAPNSEKTFSERLSAVRPGMTRQQTEQILGQKLKLEKYDDRSLQAIFPEGVMLFFSEDKIHSIHYLKPYSLPVDGIRIGDSPDFVRSQKGEPGIIGGFPHSWNYAGTDSSYSVRYDFFFPAKCTDIFLFAKHSTISQPIQSSDASTKEQIISGLKKTSKTLGQWLSALFRLLGKGLSAVFKWYGRAWKHANFWGRFGLAWLAIFVTVYATVFTVTAPQMCTSCVTNCSDNSSYSSYDKSTLSNQQSVNEPYELYTVQEQEEDKKFSDLTIEGSFNFEYSKNETDTNGFTYQGNNIGVLSVEDFTYDNGYVIFDVESSDYQYIGGLLSHGGESYKTMRLTFYAYYGEVIGWKQLGDVIEIEPLDDPRILCLPLESSCKKIKIEAQKMQAGLFDQASRIILYDFRLWKENPENYFELPKYLDEKEIDKETTESLAEVGKSGRDINKLNIVHSSNFRYTNEFTDKDSNRFLGDNIGVMKMEGYSMGDDISKLVFSTDSRNYKYIGGILSCGSENCSINLEIHAYCNGTLIKIGDTMEISSSSGPIKLCLPINSGCTKIYISAQNPTAGYSGPTIELMLYHFRLYKEDPSEIIDNEMPK